MFSDHTRANIDHRAVFSDHTRANIDHRGVFNDHTRANIDHRPVFSMHSMVIAIHIDHNNGFSRNFNDHKPVFRMRSMVIFKHIDYNNSCTRVFRMCLMVIDMCIDKTLGILGQFTLKRVHAEDAGAVVRRQGSEQSAKPAVDAVQAPIILIHPPSSPDS